ncbi:hypothetical protein [Streptomyces sp. NPDC004728]|uniref:hypothetical protein n=1 Tax=Streptomyces sp. NPDC004728 TaxID=3154289 RepID=UPI0033AE3B03
MNRQDIAHQVSTTLGDHADDYDIDGIVDDLVAAHGGQISSIDDFDSESYWAIVETHDTTADEPEPTTAAWLTLNAGSLIYNEGAEVGILDHADDAALGEVLAPLTLPVSLTEARDDHGKAMLAAETRLAELGWTIVGKWYAVDTGYTVKVRRAPVEN